MLRIGKLFEYPQSKLEKSDRFDSDWGVLTCNSSSLTSSGTVCRRIRAELLRSGKKVKTITATVVRASSASAHFTIFSFWNAVGKSLTFRDRKFDSRGFRSRMIDTNLGENDHESARDDGQAGTGGSNTFEDEFEQSVLFASWGFRNFFVAFTQLSNPSVLANFLNTTALYEVHLSTTWSSHDKWE